MAGQGQAVPPLRAVPIFDALTRHGVRYIAVGSYPAIVQGVDLPMTDLDIVPVAESDNHRRLVKVLEELDARERVGDREEPIDDLLADPESIAHATFRTFDTKYGELDVVLRPAGFPRGYDDLVANVVVATLQDEADPMLRVDAVLASVDDIYESKRQAGRPKDIDALAAFPIHEMHTKDSVRARDRADLARRENGDESRQT